MFLSKGKIGLVGGNYKQFKKGKLVLPSYISVLCVRENIKWSVGHISFSNGNVNAE